MCEVLWTITAQTSFMARFIAGFMARFIDGFMAKLSSWGSWLSSWPHSAVCLQVLCFKRRNHYWSCQANIKTSDLWKGLAVSAGNLFAPLNFAEERKHLIWGRSFSNTKPRNGKEFPQSTGLISQSLRWFTLEMSQGGGSLRRASSPSSRSEKMPTWRSEIRWPFGNPVTLSKLILDASAFFFFFFCKRHFIQWGEPSILRHFQWKGTLIHLSGGRILEKHIRSLSQKFHFWEVILRMWSEK